MAVHTYTIGVKSKFGLFYKKYQVVGHEEIMAGGITRLLLNEGNGSVTLIPDVAKMYVKIYPDFKVASDFARKQKEQETNADQLPGL